MPTITLESSERSKRKSRLRTNLRGYGSRHGETFWKEEKQRKNFGLKYMGKFGWNQGDGLGKHKQGDTTHVKSKYKNDTKGIGCNHAPNDTMFQATMCMFNDILSGLNKEKKDTDNNDNSSAEHTKRSTPMTASAMIRSYEAKHHLYSRFRAAKQIENRSEEDKAAIFGTGSSSKGFTENDQESYAMAMNALSSGYAGKQGLGYGVNRDDNARNNTLLYGKFTQSGRLMRLDNENNNNDDKSNDEKSDSTIDTTTVVTKDTDKKKSKKKKKDKDKKKSKKKKDKKIEQPANDACEEHATNGKKEKKKKKKKDKKSKKDKKRKLKDVDNDSDIVNEPARKKLKVTESSQDTSIPDDSFSDYSSSVLTLSAQPTPIFTPIQSDADTITTADGDDIDEDIDRIVAEKIKKKKKKKDKSKKKEKSKKKKDKSKKKKKKE